MVFLRRDITDVFRCVSGRVTGREDERTETEFVAVLYRFWFEAILRSGFAARVNFCPASAIGQLARAADQISVNVRFENVRNGDAVLSRQLQINFHIGPWIDYRGGAFFVIADQIRDRGDAIGQNAFKNERHSFPYLYSGRPLAVFPKFRGMTGPVLIRPAAAGAPQS
jgi:hypothetical protein